MDSYRRLHQIRFAPAVAELNDPARWLIWPALNNSSHPDWYEYTSEGVIKIKYHLYVSNTNALSLVTSAYLQRRLAAVFVFTVSYDTENGQYTLRDFQMETGFYMARDSSTYSFDGHDRRLNAALIREIRRASP